MDDRYSPISAVPYPDLVGKTLGTPPQLIWIDRERLVIDSSYQRQLSRANWTAIRKIATEFHWSKFGALMVSPVEGGLFAIVDGQHRANAAGILGLDSLPAIVVPMTHGEQASAFAAINQNVIKVTPLQIFKAARASGEHWAIELDEVCDRAGVTPMTSNKATLLREPGEIYSISLLKKLLAKNPKTLVGAGLASLRKSESGEMIDVWAHGFLSPWLITVCARPWFGDEIDSLANFLDEAPIFELIDKAQVEATRLRRLGENETRMSMLQTLLGSALDHMYPQRMALPTIAV